MNYYFKSAFKKQINIRIKHLSSSSVVKNNRQMEARRHTTEACNC